MWSTKRRFVRVGLFFAVLAGAFTGSLVFAPSASAAGEYYQYIPPNTVKVTGGVVLTPGATLTRTGPNSFQGNINVAGGVARIPNGNDQTNSAPCTYSLGATDIQGDLNLPGPGGGGHTGLAGFPNPGLVLARGPGECKYGQIVGENDIQSLITRNISIVNNADPRGPTGGAGPAASCSIQGFQSNGTECFAPPDANGNCAPGSTLREATASAGGSRNGTCIAPLIPPGEEDDGCPVQRGEDLRWLYCPVFAGMNGFFGFLDQFINEYLKSDNKIFDEDSGYRNAWAIFRNLAIGLVVIAGLIMLISEALGLQIIDAYTRRVVMQRLLLAIVGISLSWDLARYMIGFFDDLGQAMASIIYTSFLPPGTVEPNAAQAIFSAILAILGILAAGGAVVVASAAANGGALLTGLGILSMIGPILLTALVAAGILVARQGIMVALVLVAPVAIASLILKGTSRLGELWWSTSTSMLYLYPMATGFVAIFKVLGILTIGSAGTSESGLNSVVGNVVGIFLIGGGYVMILVSFRLAGGVGAAISNAAFEKTRGASDLTKKMRGSTMSEGFKKIGGGGTFKNGLFDPETGKGTNFKGKLNNAGMRLGLGRHGQFGFGDQGKKATANKLKLLADAEAKTEMAQYGGHEDDLLQGLQYQDVNTHRKNMVKDFKLVEREAEKLFEYDDDGNVTNRQASMAQAVDKAQKRVEESIIAVAASGGYSRARQLWSVNQGASTGTTLEDQEVLLQSIARVSGGSESTAATLLGSSRGAAEKQGGRYDQKAAFGMQMDLVKDAMANKGNIDPVKMNNAVIDAVQGVSAAQAAQGKPKAAAKGIEAINLAARTAFETANSTDPSITHSQRTQASGKAAELVATASNLESGKMYGSVAYAKNLHNNQTGIGSSNEIDYVYNAVKESATPQPRRSLTGEIERDPVTRQPIMNRPADPVAAKTYRQLANQRYDPNDPNLPHQPEE